MKHSHLLFMLISVLLCPSIAVSSEAETSQKMPNINIPLISLESRMLKGTGPRSNYIIHLLDVTGSTSSEMGPVSVVASIDTHTFVHQNEYSASADGFGKLYYKFGDLDGPAHKRTFLMPSATLYRKLELDTGSIGKLRTRSNILLPALQFTQRLSDAVRFHLDAELLSYTERGNYTIKGGVSYVYSPPWVLSAIYERRSWDIAIEEGGTLYQMEGLSESAYLKAIYRLFGEINNGAAINVYLGVGSERMINRATPGLLDPADIDTRGTMVQFGVDLGFAAW